MVLLLLVFFIRSTAIFLSNQLLCCKTKTVSLSLILRMIYLLVCDEIMEKSCHFKTRSINQQIHL